MTFLLMAMTFAAPQDAPYRKVGDRNVEVAETRQPEREIGLLVTSGMARPTQLGSSAVGYNERENPATTPARAAPTILGPYCPTGFVIAQRYDDRRSDGVIWKATWISKCVPAPKIKWRKRVRELIN